MVVKDSSGYIYYVIPGCDTPVRARYVATLGKTTVEIEGFRNSLSILDFENLLGNSFFKSEQEAIDARDYLPLLDKVLEKLNSDKVRSYKATKIRADKLQRILGIINE